MLSQKVASRWFLTPLIAIGLVLSASISAGEGRPVEMDFAGGFIRNIEQTDVDFMGIPVGTSRVSVAILKAKGSLGKADLMAVTKAGPPLSPTPCPGGFIKVADINSNNLLFTFEDLSMLWGDGEGVVCINPGTGEQYVAIAGHWTGGSKRFEGAGGDFSVQFDVNTQISAATQFIAESGQVTGHLTRSSP